jgi:hypothetical protein
VTFYRFLHTARQPVRAARDAMGQLPERAVRYCDAAATASSFGWLLHPPMDFSLLWDGQGIVWTWGERKDWLRLDAAQFPGYAAEFDATVPPAMRGFSPPFLTALPESGLVQVWTGFFARSAPGWSILVRPPANIACAEGVVTYEGIVEADAWFGPLFTNLRLTRRNESVRLSASRPFLQVQPVQRRSYCEDAMNSMSLVHGLQDLTQADWAEYATTIVRRGQTPSETAGSYAIAARRRRKRECPAFSHPGETQCQPATSSNR